MFKSTMDFDRATLSFLVSIVNKSWEGDTEKLIDQVGCEAEEFAQVFRRVQDMRYVDAEFTRGARGDQFQIPDGVTVTYAGLVFIEECGRRLRNLQ